ncbi:hypothetical protein BU24DRAFT_494606 [Aaosphaeria arxii CBS 175.79]|uniref:Nuclease PA3 n=1 Tax=Aaosphaeria arxii CBS 175.79 TaxID=1450172 RepID=A0A6A5XHP6_9PLEO|nr:uncharacterized protein BU24DRAFT_494606 [Aaosphaeria arxii CBS 175.79]KAF2012642.1 hypothetical protein BU24DRAFT_494606 [Aaosphaeria arxii CBS 175.79]
MVLLLALLPLFSSTVSAWGTLGHTTVAIIAQQLVDKKTASLAQHLLNDTSSNYLAHIATWADSYRKEPEGEFSSPLHYIDALDQPPKSCNVDYERDCPEEGCIVSAIANYTSRVQAKSHKISLVERQKALKWIVHFIGDIHQPLHVENLEIGGNLINVTFDGKAANLHHIWDTEIPEKLIGGYALEDSTRWATTLVGEIKNGSYAHYSKKWLRGIDKHDSIETAMVWARDSNSYVCSTVVPDGADAVRDHELGGAYYDKAIPVVQLQVAKAGYRLAAWLNIIATGKTGLGDEDYGHGYPHVRPPKGYKTSNAKRSVKLEDWMVGARQMRRDFGWGCDHAH